MFDYFGLFIVFMATIVAIKGETWNKKKKGIRQITTTGFITLILGLLGLLVSIMNTHSTKADSREKSIKLNDAVKYSSEAGKKIVEANKKLGKINEILNSANDVIKELKFKLSGQEVQIAVYKKMLDVIREILSRQIQTVLASFVELRPVEVWNSPSFIYGGSIVKTYGFSRDLLLFYGDSNADASLFRRVSHELKWMIEDGKVGDYLKSIGSRGNFKFQIIMGETNGYQGHSEVAIVGNSGKPMRWGVVNLSKENNYGKIFVESTPRIRTADWSWLEEAISSIEKKGISSEVTVNCPTLNMRSEPTIKGKIIAQLRAGEFLTIVDKKGPWCLVHTESLLKGWVHEGNVKMKK